MGQELLSTFGAELGSVTLIPDDTGGVFEVRVDQHVEKDAGGLQRLDPAGKFLAVRLVVGAEIGHSGRQAFYCRMSPGLRDLISVVERTRLQELLEID